MIVEVNELNKSYGPKHVLNNISFQFEENQIVAILGPNGVGKTTLLEVLMTLTSWDTGRVEILGKNLKKQGDIHALRKQIGVVFQDGGMYAYLKIKEILDLFASFHDVSENQIHEIIELFSLESHLNIKFDKLSGGWKKRILLACAFLNKPEVLFLDEPTTGLDPQATEDLWEAIRQANRQDVMVMLSTHSLEEVDMYADYCIILNDGEIVEQGKPKELKERYDATYFKEAYFSIVNKKVSS